MNSVFRWATDTNSLGQAFRVETIQFDYSAEMITLAEWIKVKAGRKKTEVTVENKVYVQHTWAPDSVSLMKLTHESTPQEFLDIMEKNEALYAAPYNVIEQLVPKDWST